jgi:hypothetical protein
MVNNNRNWSYAVTHRKPGTFPPAGTFTLPGEKMAKVMAKPEVSPNGLGSAIQMVQFFINRAGKKLDPKRKAELEKCKRILQKMKRNNE